MDAARSEFGTRGYAATQSGDIAKAAGVAVGTFYEYFTDKRSAFLVLIGEMFDMILSIDMAAYFSREPTTTRWYRLIDLFREFAGNTSAFRKIDSEITAAAVYDEEIDRELRVFEDKMLRRLGEIISDGIALDASDRVQAASRLIWSVIQSTRHQIGGHDAIIAEASFAIDRYLVALGR